MNTLADFYNDQWKSLGDFIRYNPGSRHRRRLIAKTVRRLRPKRILDVGCGNAELILSLLREGFEPSSLVGCDLSNEVISKNRTMLPNVRFEQLDIQSGSLSDKFDLITFSEVIEHLELRQECLSNIREMLSPGGHLILTCPTGKVFATERAFGHVSHPTLSEIDALAQVNRFEVIDRAAWGWPTYLLTKHLVNINPKMALKNFAFRDYTHLSKTLAIFLYYLNFLNFHNSSLGCQLFVLLKAL